jgi:two-component system response regulator ChvI
LGVEGIVAAAFSDSVAAAESFDRALPDLAVLGTDAASMGGLELCRRLRSRVPALPIVVTARETDVHDGALLHSGADDYLPKPFSINELMARVRVLLRRAFLTGTETLALEDRPLTLGALAVDPLRLSAQWKGHDLRLTVTEFFILHALVRRVGVVKTGNQLMQEAYPGRASNERMIDSHIRHLRAKFEAHDASFDALEGVHNAGYRYHSRPGMRRP